ncbi:uncharacterized protein BDR25DRAFT_357492 [Lindgomyces ingoldianus]|uniref:Uncharacterized protein n=1 Tax=Lindgomyces ingoldianus TaxID=673940 RepID=A0ACB6QQW6_9PLEO|nr:uncharacterized protein BDR25DRAFT_357492 [Lindgomyces ingoldianus]KAF2468561.1 hypothetical protein BDR25DRAFT_357492 [Lindgomyces ingoldianus]
MDGRLSSSQSGSSGEQSVIDMFLNGRRLSSVQSGSAEWTEGYCPVDRAQLTEGYRPVNRAQVVRGALKLDAKANSEEGTYGKRLDKGARSKQGGMSVFAVHGYDIA